jgi:hypothetical protein
VSCAGIGRANKEIAMQKKSRNRSLNHRCRGDGADLVGVNVITSAARKRVD